MHQLQKNAHTGAVSQIVGGIAIAISAVAFDIWTKQVWFGNDVALIPHVLAITSHRNTGLLFDIPFAWWMSASVTALLLVVLCFVALTRTQKHSLQIHIGLWLIIGGGIGNLWDRVVLHFVRDWILLFGRSAFNIADMCVLLGIILVGIDSSRRPHLDNQVE